MNPKILAVMEDPAALRSLEETLKEDFIFKNFSRAEEALKGLREEGPDLLILDYDLKDMEGFELLKRFWRLAPSLKVLIISKRDEISAAVSAAKLGVADFLPKPLQAERLLDSLKKILSPKEEKRLELKEIEGAEWLWGISPKASALIKGLEEAVPGRQDLLLLGEKGLEKEGVAKILLLNGPNPKRRLIGLELSSFEGKGQESFFWVTLRELLGEAEAVAEEERCGILCLKGLESIDPHFRLSLLTFLKERGSPTPPFYDPSVRIVLMLEDAGFLKESQEQDLLAKFYRLEIPPLRERKEDLPLLIDLCLKQAEKRFGKRATALSSEILALLSLYDWPGNVEELKATLEVAVMRAEEPTLTLKDFSLHLPLLLSSVIKKNFALRDFTLEGFRRSWEKLLLEILFAQSSGGAEGLAALLDLPKSEVYDRLQEYGIGVS